MFILVNDSDGGLYGRILQGVIPRFLGDDPGEPPVPHHLQCGGGSSGASLDIDGDKGAVGNDRWGVEVIHHVAIFMWMTD